MSESGVDYIAVSGTGAGVVDDLLEHVGVKGMHWGVRKSAPSGPMDVNVTEKQTRKGVVVKTSGGGGHPATAEAKATAVVNQQAKASGLHSMTNKELQTAITRMNLEQSYSRLTTPTTGAKAYVKKLLGKSGNTEISALANGQYGPGMRLAKASIAKRTAKKAATAAVISARLAAL